MNEEQARNWRRELKQHQKESHYVAKRIAGIKSDDFRIANEADIYNMSIEEFLEWFDANATRLFKSVAYSRIKNKTNYEFSHYIKTRRRIRRIANDTKSTVTPVRANSKLRTSFSVTQGALLELGSTMLFDGALTVQEMPHAGDKKLRYCVQFSGRFNKIADQFCKDIKPDVVMRTLQGIKSTAVYQRKSSELYTY